MRLNVKLMWGKIDFAVSENYIVVSEIDCAVCKIDFAYCEIDCAVCKVELAVAKLILQWQLWATVPSQLFPASGSVPFDRGS